MMTVRNSKSIATMFIFGGSFNVHRRRLSRFYSISRSQQTYLQVASWNWREDAGWVLHTDVDFNPSPFDTCWLIPEGSLASSAGSSEYLHVRAVGSFQTSGLQEIPIEQGLPWCLAMDEACWACLERKHALHTHSMLQWRSVVHVLLIFFFKLSNSGENHPEAQSFFIYTACNFKENLGCLCLWKDTLEQSLTWSWWIGKNCYNKMFRNIHCYFQVNIVNMSSWNAFVYIFIYMKHETCVSLWSWYASIPQGGKIVVILCSPQLFCQMPRW